MWVLPLIVFTVSACQDVVSEKSLLVRVVDLANAPLEGVMICETDTANCALTGADGHATLVLPTDEEFSYTATKEGYERLLQADVTDGRFDAATPPKLILSGNKATAEWMEALMSPYPQMGTGSVDVFVAYGGIEGATLDLIDATGKAYYEDEARIPTLDLEATTSSGHGGFVEVPPGDFEIELGGTVNDCYPGRAWPGSTKNRIRVPIRAGYFTVANVVCPPRP